jgi:hypothetical protein
MSRRKSRNEQAEIEAPTEAPDETPVEGAAETPVEEAAEAPAPTPEEPGVVEPEALHWRCPGCKMSWVGRPGSHGHAAYKSHIKRHAHAKPMPDRWDPTQVKPDEERRNKLV